MTRQRVHRLPRLRLAVPQIVRLVHNQQIPMRLLGDRQMRGLLDGVQAGNDPGIFTPEFLRIVTRDLFVRRHGGQTKLVIQFFLPLIHK